MTDNTFTFKSGASVALQRINGRLLGHVRSAARRKFIAENGEPTVPTYTVEAVGGVIETHEHDETTIDESQFIGDVELQAAWVEYKRLERELVFHIHEQTTRAQIWLGVADDPPPDWLASWQAEREYWGLDIPDDPRDLKFEWIFDQSTGWDELLLLTLAIQRLPDPVEEAAQAALDTFRNPVEDAGRADAGTDPEEIDEDSS